MLNEKLLQALNEQITYELYSSHLYLSMAAYCASEDLDGFANFFLVQAEEEKFHGMKFFHFVNEMDGTIRFSGLDDPSAQYTSILDVFNKALEHEKFVTKRIYHLMDLAMDEKEHATISFLKWFIDEQVEEEATFKGIIQKLKRIASDSNMLYLLDNEMGQRTFIPPTDSAQ